MPACLAGRRVLIVEDETLVALLIEDFLDELGLAHVGPFRTVDAAIEAIKAEPIDLALLDINLGNGETSYPIAEVLERIGVPFVFVSGYERPDEPRLGWHITKPFTIAMLQAAIMGVLEH
jgi:DNA-binding response OmpR family regulator